MPTITTNQGIVHYEVHGNGRPVILLHGWLGSWGLWQQLMNHLESDYRTYALDFWGFGESGTQRDANSYTVADYVDLVDQFMEALGISSVPMIGHSMGGTVSMLVAVNHPQRVNKVGVIGSPVDGSSLSLLLKLASIPTIARIVHNSLGLLKLGIRIYSPMVTRDKRWPDMMDEDLSQTSMESFLLSIKTLRETDLRQQLGDIQVPLMGMYGLRDVIVNPNQRHLVQTLAQKPFVHTLKNSGHFPMLDEPEVFMRLVKDFLDAF
jgi:pimeloyl-ACP methyl ester carboxylesterase